MKKKSVELHYVHSESLICHLRWLGKWFAQIWFWPLVLSSQQFCTICSTVSVSYSLHFMMTPLRIMTSLWEKNFFKIANNYFIHLHRFYRIDILYDTQNSVLKICDTAVLSEGSVGVYITGLKKWLGKWAGLDLKETRS